MIDIVEVQQFISNLPSVEKVSSSPQVLAVNATNITQQEMDIADEVRLSTVIESGEVLKPVNDKEKKPGGGKEEEENGREKKDKEKTGEERDRTHIDLIV